MSLSLCGHTSLAPTPSPLGGLTTVWLVSLGRGLRCPESRLTPTSARVTSNTSAISRQSLSMWAWGGPPHFRILVAGIDAECVIEVECNVCVLALGAIPPPPVPRICYGCDWIRSKRDCLGRISADLDLVVVSVCVCVYGCGMDLEGIWSTAMAVYGVYGLVLWQTLWLNRCNRTDEGHWLTGCDTYVYVKKIDTVAVGYCWD